MAEKGTSSAYLFITISFLCKLSVYQAFNKLSANNQHCITRDSDIVCSYIPKDIPAGIKTVSLRNLSSNYFPDKILWKGSFLTHNWRRVKKLEISADSDWLDEHDTVEGFNSSCFFGLQHLEELHISISRNIRFTPQTLNGLNNLKLLDLSGCRRFDLDNLLNLLNRSGVVPNLQSINLSRVNSYRNGLSLSERFFKLISKNQIKELDISSTQIMYLNITSFFKNCHSLEFVNISKLYLNSYTRGFDQLCPNLKFIDASYITLPTKLMPDRDSTYVLFNKTFMFDLNWTWLKNFKRVQYLNISALMPKRTKYSMENVTVYILGEDKFDFKVLIFRENNFERLDMRVIIPNCTIEKVDFSRCNIRYFHPGVLSSLLSLKWIDLSGNNLNDMMIENAELFGEMFRNLSQLRYISLAGNYLSEIPSGMFAFNKLVEIIDLSNNRLTKLSLEFWYLKHLTLLDLTRNMIKTIDIASLKSHDNLSLLLRENPISCSSCDSLPFVHWLLTSETTNKSLELKCKDENSKQVYINKDVIKNLQEICNRPIVIMISCIVSVVLVLVSLALLLLFRRYRRRQKYKNEMEERVALIRQGAEQYKFAVFLSYCSKDDDFVSNFVYQPLNEHLQNSIGEDRDLVCEGDRNFQLGRPIPEQISILLKKSSVVVVLLTDNYSRSKHCRNEFDQAFMLEKPIVLMIKDQVDTDLMTPHIRDIYENRTRILWMRENGQYVLKNTWDNVCTSIVELVDNKGKT